MGGEDVKHFYDEIGTNCQYKKDNFKTYFNDKKWYLEKDYVVKVVEIVKDKGDTYDFSVEETHKYSALGYINHNCAYINHNCATFSHYEIINKMYDEGYLDEGFMMEFFHNHSNVIFQPGFDSPYYSGLNPYTLGFNIFSDLKRMSLDPTEEDKQWFPEIAGKGNWAETFRYIVENFKDETFVLQYLSPKVIRDMKMFEVTDREDSRFYNISSIHDERGYKAVRQSLSETYNRATYYPDIQAFDVDVNGDRTLTLNYTPVNSKQLDSKDVDVIVSNISKLWGFPVTLIDDGDINDIIATTKSIF
jgi:spore cortex formation protein SpoVR/YcgB (stage V sporulation)